MLLDQEIATRFSCPVHRANGVFDFDGDDQAPSAIESSPEEFDDLQSIEDLSHSLNRFLRRVGTRLPFEDELEAAFWGRAFPWGDEIPDGIPYQNQTSFLGHTRPSLSGLRFNSSSYVVEIADGILKLGDGGEAVCGAYPPPIGWLCYSPSFRLADSDIEGCFWEFLEDAEFRQVLL
ncbi:MAG: hypothetical protein R3F11_20590 [Verrucomicrobiales bacterium]